MAKKAAATSAAPVWYKVVGPKGQAISGGSGVWKMPKGDKPGDWMPKVDYVHACHSGYHLIPKHGIRSWANPGYQLCIAEGRGIQDDGRHSDGKVAFAEARIIKVLGVFPKGWSSYNTSGDRKTGDEIIKEVINPKAYAKKEALAKKKAKLLEAKRVAKERAAALKAKKERDAIRKKWAPARVIYRKTSRHMNWAQFIIAYCAIKGIKTRASQHYAICRAF